jgi:hypothetical protein
MGAGLVISRAMKRKREVVMLTTGQVAKRIGAAEISVRVWAAKGRFPGARKEIHPRGDYWLIPEAALQGFEKEKPGPKPGSKKKSNRKESVN